MSVHKECECSYDFVSKDEMCLTINKTFICLTKIPIFTEPLTFDSENVPTQHMMKFSFYFHIQFPIFSPTPQIYCPPVYPDMPALKFIMSFGEIFSVISRLAPDKHVPVCQNLLLCDFVILVSQLHEAVGSPLQLIGSELKERQR